jgi:hypothetical protein
MTKKTVISILCTLSWLLAAYAAYAYVYFAWLSATPLTNSQLKRVQYDAKVWLGVLCVTIIAAPALGWWRFRLARTLPSPSKEPIQQPQQQRP